MRSGLIALANYHAMIEVLVILSWTFQMNKVFLYKRVIHGMLLERFRKLSIRPVFDVGMSILIIFGSTLYPFTKDRVLTATHQVLSLWLERFQTGTWARMLYRTYLVRTPIRS